MKKLMMLPKHATGHLKFNSNFLQWVGYYAKPGILPILLALIPTLYHYSNNVEILTLTSLFRMLAFNTVLAIVIYLACLVFTRFRMIKASNAAFVFLIFFNVYGLAYRYLVDLDVIRIKHYTLLPLTLMLAAYSILFIARLRNSALVNFWKNLVLIACVLVLFNLINIVPVEVKKWNNNRTTASLIAQEEISPAKDSPDIYYIILDEFAGFQAMREYWNYHEVDEFVRFLKGRDFFVAEASHGSTTDTLYEMATRLNYQEYPPGGADFQTYFQDIADNQVMRYLKSRGYTTVVFDETNLGYPAAKSINADYLYEYGSSSIPQSEKRAYEFYFDEFGELVIDNTMLYAVSRNYRGNSPMVSQHSNMISFTVNHIADKKVPSPKFVYVHLLLPHAPFVFNADGSHADSDRITNWNYYIDNYKFSIKVAEAMVNKILSESDPKNPPVIILQSDHGARNHLANDAGSVILEDYPEEYKSLIMYALYLPGYDYSNLPQDIKAVNTFPIVFNYLFDEDIALLK